MFRFFFFYFILVEDVLGIKEESKNMPLDHYFSICVQQVEMALMGDPGMRLGGQ